MKTTNLVVAASLLLLFAAHGAQAAGQSSTSGYSDTQVDGITSSVVDNLWSYTDYWWHRGDYPRVIALDRVITEADPHFLEPYATGGWLMESDGNLSDAEKYYTLGATRNPHTAYLWFNLGFFYFNTKKDFPDAIKSFQSATNAPDAGINCWKMLAHSYERNNQIDKALVVWQKLQKDYPTDGVVAHNLDKDQKLLLASAPTSVNSPSP